MRSALLVCLALAFATYLIAQNDVPPDQCLGGWVTAIQPDAITLKFNEKIATVPIAPGAEIWRRGVDLESAQQLVVGDQVFLKCARGADGAVVASVVAAVEKDLGIELVPHHIKEIGACLGKLTAIGSDTISMKNEKGACVVRFDAQTTFWRGEESHDPGILRKGDFIGARYFVEYPGHVLKAESVEANVAKTEGIITAVRPDRIVVNDFHPHERFTVLVDARTRLYPEDGRLEKGSTVLAIGLELGHKTFRATGITVEESPLISPLK